MIFWGATIIAVVAALQIVGRAISQWRLPALARPRIFYDRQAFRKLAARGDPATSASVVMLAEFRSPAEFSSWTDYASAVRCHAIAFLTTGDPRHAKRACYLFQHPPTPAARADPRPAVLGKALCWLAQSFDALYPELGKTRCRDRVALMLAFLAHRLYRAPANTRSVLQSELWRCAGLIAAAVALAGQDLPDGWSTPRAWYRYARTRLAVLSRSALDYNARPLSQVLAASEPLAEICLVLGNAAGEAAVDPAARDAFAIRLLGMRPGGARCIDWRTLAEHELPLPVIQLILSPRWRPYAVQAALSAGWQPRTAREAALWIAALPPQAADTRAWTWKAGGAAGLRLLHSGDSHWLALVPLRNGCGPVARLFTGLNGCWRAIDLAWAGPARLDALHIEIAEASAEGCIIEAHGKAVGNRTVFGRISAALLPGAAAVWLAGARIAQVHRGTPGAGAIEVAWARSADRLCLTAALGSVRRSDGALLASSPGLGWQLAVSLTDAPASLAVAGAQAQAILLATDGHRAAAASCQRIRFANQIQVLARPRAICIATLQ